MENMFMSYYYHLNRIKRDTTLFTQNHHPKPIKILSMLKRQ
ncbi:hypothetical protein [uncultured Gammaproteobacteria bacterium]|nr:hypothetical protein [uncultured Gammaproteobacteria bacterium]